MKDSDPIIIIYRHYPKGEILFVKKQILKKQKKKDEKKNRQK